MRKQHAQLENVRLQEEANLAQARGERGAQEQLRAHARLEFDRKQAALQLHSTGFQLAHSGTTGRFSRVARGPFPSSARRFGVRPTQRLQTSYDRVETSAPLRPRQSQTSSLRVEVKWMRPQPRQWWYRTRVYVVSQPANFSSELNDSVPASTLIPSAATTFDGELRSDEQTQTSTQVGAISSGDFLPTPQSDLSSGYSDARLNARSDAANLRNGVQHPNAVEAHQVSTLVKVEAELRVRQVLTPAIQPITMAIRVTHASSIGARSTWTLTSTTAATYLGEQGVVRIHLTLAPSTTPNTPQTLTRGGGTNGPGRSSGESGACVSPPSGPDSGVGFVVKESVRQLETDGIREALGAVLKQKFDDTNLEHPVGFFSRSLTGSERIYVAYELEMYAMVRAVENFRVFLLGREFLLRTDHAALRNLLKRDLPAITRVERWILRLSEYTFRIEHQKGQGNIIADVLS